MSLSNTHPETKYVPWFYVRWEFLYQNVDQRYRKPTNRFLHLLQCFKPSRPRGSTAVSTHRCLLIPEIFHLILDFLHQHDESSEDGECSEDEKLSRQALASLARTCRAFNAPALDLLWMRLDSLDPLIKVLPNRMWATKRSFVLRMLMKDKHWLTFHKYASRVRFLRGPCSDIPPCVQRNVINALARIPKATLPLTPNLTELVWSESDAFSVIDPTVTLIKFFAGPGVTSISLFLVSWPIFVSARTLLADLPVLFPNVTSFTAVPRVSLNDHSQDIGDIACKWSNLQALRSCPLSQTIMDELASRQTLTTFSLELHTVLSDVYVDKLPGTIHTFSLGGASAMLCIQHLQSLQGSLTSFNLRFGPELTHPSDIDTLFQMLPLRFDTTQLRDLTISLKSSFTRTSEHDLFPLRESLLASLYLFSSLITLDLDWFCASELDDAAYEDMARAWPELRSLKIGVADESRMRPIASVGAVIAVLRSCPHLQTLHIVFDGSIPPPSPAMALEVEETAEERSEVGSDRTCVWGVTNAHITQMNVGHSPTGNELEGIKRLALCLKSVMPQLERIKSIKELPARKLGWWTVEGLMSGDVTGSTIEPALNQPARD